MTEEELKQWMEKNMSGLQQDLARLQGLDADLTEIAGNNPILHGPKDELSFHRLMKEVRGESDHEEK
ncbi:hypothetical protein V8J88_01005 [Massilia sp. W12]|uniref:hypothetical protein n=1 Tax=Massilia sp. W12 TaxID=3126507 RepID=UPI0030CCEC74